MHTSFWVVILHIFVCTHIPSHWYLFLCVIMVTVSSCVVHGWTMLRAKWEKLFTTDSAWTSDLGFYTGGTAASVWIIRICWGNFLCLQASSSQHLLWRAIGWIKLSLCHPKGMRASMSPKGGAVSLNVLVCVGDHSNPADRTQIKPFPISLRVARLLGAHDTELFEQTWMPKLSPTPNTVYVLFSSSHLVARTTVNLHQVYLQKFRICSGVQWRQGLIHWMTESCVNFWINLRNNLQIHPKWWFSQGNPWKVNGMFSESWPELDVCYVWCAHLSI